MTCSHDCKCLQPVAEIINLDSFRWGAKVVSGSLYLPCYPPCCLPLAIGEENELNRKNRASWWVFLIVLLGLAPFAFSQQTVNLTLVDGGSNTMGGIYVGPYDATQNGQPVQIICDDFQHEVSAGESWSATVTSVSNLTNSTSGLVWSGHSAGGTDLFGSGYIGTTSFSTLQGYDAMAYLASEMLPLSGNKANATEVGYMAYAIWAIFDAGAVQTWLNNHGEGSIWGQVQSLAEGALKGTYTQSQFAGWEILTPMCSAPNSCPNGPPQEFFEYVPEGGSALMYLLLAGLSCFAAMFLSRRRRATSEVV